MTDKQKAKWERDKAAIRKQTIKLIDKWRPLLNLQEWNFEIIFPGSPDPEDAMADCSAKPEYLEATIRFYPCFFNVPKDVREHTVVHELCHCIVAELQHAGEDLMEGQLVTKKNHQDLVERLTQRISYIAMKDKWPERKKR